MHENRFNEYRIPSGMLIVFLEKALTLIHMETHLDDVSASVKLILPSIASNSLASSALLTCKSATKRADAELLNAIYSESFLNWCATDEALVKCGLLLAHYAPSLVKHPRSR